MPETRGLVWLRDHWIFAPLIFTVGCLLVAGLLMGNLHRDGIATQRFADVAAERGGGSPPLRVMATLAPNAKMAHLPLDKNAGASPTPLSDRKIAYTGEMEFVVSEPAQGADRIHQLALSVGGYVESAQITGSRDSASATTTILVPAARFQEVTAELKTMAIRVESEKTDAQDVTKQYVDTQAQLTNLRAEEAQYLQIMRSATKVQDMLDVSEKLSEVRGQIDQAQAEFASLSKQVEMVSITISLRPQVQPASFAMNWQPMQRVKISLRDAANGLADYATAMLSTLFYLPVILLWAVTIVLGASIVWRSFRWTAKRFFKFPPGALIEKSVS